MTVLHKQGNAVDALLSGEVTYLIHVTNCQGIMSSGIAKEIKERVPRAYHNYKLSGYHHGQISFGSGVWNLHAQEYYGRGGRFINYGALSNCLSELRYKCDKGDVIGVPYLMGSDRAGGDWEIVTELVEWYLKDFDIIYYRLV